MTEQEAHATLKEQGRQVLGEILGESYLAKRDATNNDFWGPTRQLSEELAYASLWTREGLDRKQRSMITVAMLCALNRPHELRIHLLGALNNGCSKIELREIFTHAIAYCGFPAAQEGIRALRKASAEYQAEAAKKDT